MLKPFRGRAARRFRRVIEISADFATAVDRRRRALHDFEFFRVADRGLVVTPVLHAPESAIEVVAGLAANEQGAGNAEVTSGETSRRGGNQIVDGLDVVARQHLGRHHGYRSRYLGKRRIQPEHGVGRSGWDNFKRIELFVDVHRGRVGAGRERDLKVAGACDVLLFESGKAWKLGFDRVSAGRQRIECELPRSIRESALFGGCLLIYGGHFGAR